MIKVAITGADTPQAGELLRILVNHPEVIITTLSAPGKEGISVTSVHHGLIGEEKMNFTGPLSMTPDCDVVFICGNSMTAAEFSALQLARPDLRTIMVDSINHLDHERMGVVYGLPEINRKMLVRGAVSARVPSPIASAVLTALYPIANNMLLNDSLEIDVNAPADVLDKEKAVAEKEINEILNNSQPSFDKQIVLNTVVSDNERAMRSVMTLSCAIALEQIQDIYEIYDDHNFAFPIISSSAENEVMGTNKCVITYSKPDDSTLRIEAVADPRLRGGAGEAVHIMNLLFGLHEKTGLALKASSYNVGK
ncbi:MAG: hypothetical protein K2M93_07830 [Muribaculaceae bacterium]|nr:hypothetical protein [Muribaculaceae bacterium]